MLFLLFGTLPYANDWLLKTGVSVTHVTLDPGPHAFASPFCRGIRQPVVRKVVNAKFLSSPSYMLVNSSGFFLFLYFPPLRYALFC